MSIFVGDTAPSKIFVGDTEVSKVFVGDTQVRPSGWQPGANTLAYYPLTTTYTTSDESGNNYDLTNRGGASFNVYDGVDCAYINYGGRNALYNNNNIWGTIIGTQNFTYSVWIKYVSASANWTVFINNDGGSEDRALGILNNKLVAYIWSNGQKFAYGDVPTTNTRYCLGLTYDGTDLKLYQNGVLKASAVSGGSTASGTILGIGYGLNGYVSNVIVEDKARTATEMADYYDLTKGDYGL